MKLNIYGNQPIIAPRDPVQLMEVATKNYVDTNLSLHAQDTSVHITAAQNVWLDAITVSSAEVNYLSGLTGNIQTQIDGKVSKAGDTMTGLLTLSGQPTDNLHAVTKSYSDQRDAERVAKAGDTMTGPLTLSGDPTANLHAVTKQYVDSSLSTHANNQELHLTAAQNTWLDAITVSAVEVNQLSGIQSNVQDQINAKFDKAGGLISGDVTLAAGKAVFVSKAPVADNELVNKAYVDAKAKGQEWKDPVSDINLVDLALTTTVGLPAFAVGIVASGASGNLAGLDGHAVYVDAQGVLIDIKGTPVAAGDRFGVALQAGFVPVGGLSTKAGSIITISDATAGAIQFTEDTLTAGSSVLVFDEQSKHFGETYTLSDAGAWVLTNTSVNLTAGDGLEIAGKMLNVLVGKGLYLDTNFVSVKLATGSAVALNVNGEVELRVKDTTITQDADGIRVSTDVMAAIADRVSKTSGGTIDGQVVFSTISSLSLGFTPTDAAHAVNKGYVDNAAQQIQTQVTTLTGKVAVLEQDPTTKSYVDSQVGTKVSKAGDTMTGPLTLPGAPTGTLHAATKGYVDSSLSAHANDDTVHLTAAQNTWLDAIGVTSAEVNQLSGIQGNVQDQLDSKLDLAGGVMTGPIQLAADPVQSNEASTKGYVDTQVGTKVSKAGDTMTGPLTLPGAPVSDLQAATKGYVDSSVTTAAGTLTTQINTKVSKAGDTMTGFLTLNADPQQTYHAATKQYVDSGLTSTKTYIDNQDSALQSQITSVVNIVNVLNTDPVTKTYTDDSLATKVAKAGDTLTGYLVLHADPQQPMHPATKQYVDAVAQGLSTKPSVRLATVVDFVAAYNNGSQGVNSTLTGTSNGAIVVDGITPNVGDRILVKSRANKAENGDYVVQQVGSAVTPFILKRVSTVDESQEVPGSYFYVYDGATLKGTGWVFTVDNPVTFAIGTDPISVFQFSGQGSLIAGDGLILDGNTVSVVSANANRIVVNQDSIDLAATGVTPGTYTKVIVDGYGRVLNASSPTTLAGYGIADAQPLNTNLTNLSNVVTRGLLVRDANDGIATRTLSITGDGLTVTNGSGGASGDIVIAINTTSVVTPNTIVGRDANGNFSANVITASLTGNASTASTLQTSRNFSVTGDATAQPVAFNGGSDVALNLTLANSGATAGDYTKVTVDAKGRVTAGSNPSTVAAMGLTDAATIDMLNTRVAELEKKLAEMYLFVMGRM